MTKLQELGEFVRSASSTVEPPVVRKLREQLATSNGGGNGASGQKPVARPAPAPQPPAARPAPAPQFPAEQSPVQGAPERSVPRPVTAQPSAPSAPVAPAAPAAPRPGGPARPCGPGRRCCPARSGVPEPSRPGDAPRSASGPASGCPGST